MGIKDFTALLLGDGGEYTCSSDVAGELQLYHALRNGIQQAVDRVKETTPDASEESLRQYAFGDEIGQTFLKVKECLESNGYDTSTLPYVNVPELPAGIGGLAIAGIMGGLVGYRRLRNYLSERKEKKKSYSDESA